MSRITLPRTPSLWLAIAALGAGLALGGCAPGDQDEEEAAAPGMEQTEQDTGMAPEQTPGEAEGTTPKQEDTEGGQAKAQQQDQQGGDGMQQAAGGGQQMAGGGDGPRTGEQVYQSYCQGCHLAGAAGAPKLDDAEAWEPRLAKGDKVLFEHVKNGFKAMPPMGACTTCTDQELRASIDYMKRQIP